MSECEKMRLERRKYSALLLTTTYTREILEWPIHHSTFGSGVVAFLELITQNT